MRPGSSKNASETFMNSQCAILVYENSKWKLKWKSWIYVTCVTLINSYCQIVVFEKSNWKSHNLWDFDHLKMHEIFMYHHYAIVVYETSRMQLTSHNVNLKDATESLIKLWDLDNLNTHVKPSWTVTVWLWYMGSLIMWLTSHNVDLKDTTENLMTLWDLVYLKTHVRLSWTIIVCSIVYEKYRMNQKVHLQKS